MPDGRDEALVFPFRPLPMRARLLLAATPFALAAWIVVDRYWVDRLLGGLALVACVWVGAIMAMIRRGRDGRPRQLVVTEQELTTPMWRLAWDRVADVSIGAGPAGPALVIEPVRSGDVQWSSRLFAASARLNELVRMPVIALPLRMLDPPLDDVVARLEEKASRSFGQRPAT